MDQDSPLHFGSHGNASGEDGSGVDLHNMVYETHPHILLYVT